LPGATHSLTDCSPRDSGRTGFTKPQRPYGLMQLYERFSVRHFCNNACGDYSMTPKPSKKEIEDLVQSLWVLVVDDNQYMRKMIRNLLVNCGIKDIYEAADGVAALDIIRTVAPDVVILDWEMPLLSGAELVRIVRSPGVFPMPDIPIIMLTGHCERWRVVEAAKLGVNEFLTKPVSAKALYDRLVAIMVQPRPVVQLGDYYGPEPRKLLTDPVDDTALTGS
jgi:two-component system, chemotaxis family, chemotaxis protein CheY